MNLKEELLKIKTQNIPNEVQKIVDCGLIQECEVLGDICYITFAFKLNKKPTYNYRYIYDSDFIIRENCSAIYCGGVALDNSLKILKGVIYPYFFDIPNKSELFGEVLNYEGIYKYSKGIPQILTKNMGIKLSDLFPSAATFKIYNLVTDNADCFGNFVKKKATYRNTRVPVDEKQHIVEVDYDDDTFFGAMYEYKTGRELKKVYPYGPILADIKNVVTFGYVEGFLKDCNILREITSKIYCTEKISDSIEQLGYNIKAATNKVAKSIEFLGSANKTGMVGMSHELYIANKIKMG